MSGARVQHSSRCHGADLLHPPTERRKIRLLRDRLQHPHHQQRHPHRRPLPDDLAAGGGHGAGGGAAEGRLVQPLHGVQLPAGRGHPALAPRSLPSHRRQAGAQRSHHRR